MDSYSIQSEKVTIRFKYAGDGLRLAGTEINMMKVFLNGKKASFQNLRADKDTISFEVKGMKKGKKLTVAFAQEGWCQVNLYNSAGLCAVPFTFDQVV